MKKVTLNKDSWHFKYYSSIVGDDAPKTLCPYFWTMSLLLLLSPIIFLAFISVNIIKYTTIFFDKVVPKKKQKLETMEQIIERWEKEEKEDKIRQEKWNRAGNKFFFVVKYIVFPIGVLLLFYYLFLTGVRMGWKSFLIHLGIGIVAALFIFSIVYLIDKFGGKMGKVIMKGLNFINPFSWKITQIIGEMIKAWYTNACPLVDWEGGEPEAELQFKED